VIVAVHDQHNYLLEQVNALEMQLTRPEARADIIKQTQEENSRKPESENQRRQRGTPIRSRKRDLN
jgi:hypothetical protein